MKNKTFVMGAIFTILGATFWGVSGTFGQFLFEKRFLDPGWLVTVRLLSAGFILLLFGYKKEKNKIFKIWTDKGDRLKLIFFSIFGMMSIQYTYFVAIKHSNAATATVLQYLGPVLIMIFVSIKNKKLPTIIEFISILCALIGTFFIVTHGNVKELAISNKALFLGVSSAVAMAIYTVQPESLLKKWGSLIVIGWGMVVGGIALSFVHNPFNAVGIWDIYSILMFSFIIIFGSVIAFYFYLDSTKYIGATTVSLLACVEPLAAAFFSVVWLKVPFGFMDWLGSIFIIMTIFLLSFNGNKKSDKKEVEVR